MRVLLSVWVLLEFLDAQEIGNPFVQVGHNSHVNAVAISYDNSYTASGNDDNTINVWDIKSAKLLKTFRGHFDRVRAVNIDGKHSPSARSVRNKDKSL